MTIDVDPVALSPVEWTEARRALENRTNLTSAIVLSACEIFFLIIWAIELWHGLTHTTSFWVLTIQMFSFGFISIYRWHVWKIQASAKSIVSVVSWDAAAIEIRYLVEGQATGSSRVRWADLFLFRRRADSLLLCSRQGMLILPYDLFQTEDHRQSIIDAASEAMEANRSRKFRRGWGNSSSDG